MLKLKPEKKFKKRKVAMNEAAGVNLAMDESKHRLVVAKGLV